jgi:hypothetical protein
MVEGASLEGAEMTLEVVEVAAAVSAGVCRVTVKLWCCCMLLQQLVMLVVKMEAEVFEA